MLKTWALRALLAVAALAVIVTLVRSERSAPEGAQPGPSSAAREAEAPRSAAPEPAPPPSSSARLPVLPPTSETELLEAMWLGWQTDPELAVALAAWGEERFGESPRSVERRYLEIKALVRLERIGKARSRAEILLERHPPGPMTDEIERLTGVHRRPPR